MSNATCLLVDCCLGTHIPKTFASNYAGWQGISEEDLEILTDVDQPNYWETWDDVLHNASRMEGLEARRMELEKELESMGPDREMINKKEYEKIRLSRLIERLEEENDVGIRSVVRRSATIYDGDEIKLEYAIRIIL